MVNFKNNLFWSDKNVLMKNNKNETEKLMDVRKKSLSPNKKSNAEPALKVIIIWNYLTWKIQPEYVWILPVQKFKSTDLYEWENRGRRGRPDKF